MRQKSEIQRFYQALGSEWRFRMTMEYRDLWCPNCGKETNHRVEYRRRLEKRRCTECHVTREYRM